MKKKKMLLWTVVFVCMAFAFVLSGCSDSEDEYTDDSEFTLEYVEGDYAEQLMADGAKTTLGSVKISQEETDQGIQYHLNIVGKEIVLNSDYEDGYYIAETNAIEECGVGGFAKFVYLDKNGEKIVGDAAGFMENHADEPDQLYTVYCINGNAELLLPVDPAEVKVKN